VTGVFHRKETPQSRARSIILWCKTSRRTPRPGPSGKRALTEERSSSNRIPRSALPSVSFSSTPSSVSAFSASGNNPSPHAFVTGGFAPSATITRKPWRRTAIAAASPAGPPPTIKTSVPCPMEPCSLRANCLLSLQALSMFDVVNRKKIAWLVLKTCSS